MKSGGVSSGLRGDRRPAKAPDATLGERRESRGSGRGASHRSEVFHSTLDKGIEYHSKPHVAGTEELVFCHDGQLEVGPEGREERLNSGDALWFPADVPHVYKALKRSDALIIMSYPPAQGVAR